MKKLAFGIVMFCGALLTGCAPSILGESAFNPIITTEVQPAIVTPGSVLYIKNQDSGAIALIDRRTRDAELSKLYSMPGDLRVGNVKFAPVYWVSADDWIAPPGWGFELVSQTAAREVLEAGKPESLGPGYGSLVLYTLQDRLDLVFAVRVPKDAELGEQSIVARVVSKSDKTLNTFVELFVKVESKPAPAQ